LLDNFTTLFESFNDLITSNYLSTIGLLLISSFIGSKLFQRFGIPQVVGFIVLGVLHGPSFLNVIPLELSNELLFISEIALGLIGFDMGSHLRLSEIRKLGKSILFILFFEAFGAFVLVSAGVYAVTQSLHTALIFGALACATAPAATVDVLAEYDAKGPLTTTLLAVVGMDDALSLLLYSIAAAFTAALLSGGETPTWLEVLELPFIEIGGSILMGVVMGRVLNRILHLMKSHHDAMSVSIGFVLLVAGISIALDFSLILTTMVLGMVVVNSCPTHGRHIRYTIEQAGPVIYVLFFTLVGARFQINTISAMGLLGLTYIVLRSSGKYFGAWFGGILGGAEPAVRNNLGFGLLSQAGVAIGLALASASRFSEFGEEGIALGTLIINVITATTFVVQIIGPILVKFAISRAGEVGMARFDADDIWASEGAPE
jgi:Kef-type K+ transport system membrane component KefB